MSRNNNHHSTSNYHNHYHSIPFNVLCCTYQLTFTVVSDPHAAVVGKSYGVPQAPEAYLLGPKGQVAAVFTDRLDWGDPATREAISLGASGRTSANSSPP